MSLLNNGDYYYYYAIFCAVSNGSKYYMKTFFLTFTHARVHGPGDWKVVVYALFNDHTPVSEMR